MEVRVRAHVCEVIACTSVHMTCGALARLTDPESKVHETDRPGQNQPIHVPGAFLVTEHNFMSTNMNSQRQMAVHYE